MTSIVVSIRLSAITDVGNVTDSLYIIDVGDVTDSVEVIDITRVVEVTNVT